MGTFRSVQVKLMAALFLATACSTGASAQAAQASAERLSIPSGRTSVVVEGRIRGYQTIDYLLNVRAGQPLNISLGTRHGATYFNLIEPGAGDVAVHVGSIRGNQFEGLARRSGDYRIRVYIMRSAARRGEAANFRLEAIAGRDSAVHLPERPGDALVPGTGYHASGSLMCRIGQRSMRRCEYGVRREGARGTATVTVTRPNGARRVIFFVRGRAARYDSSQADNAPFSAVRRGDDTIVRIGIETYVVPVAVIFGG